MHCPFLQEHLLIGRAIRYMHNILYIPNTRYLELEVLNECKFNDLLLGMFAQPKKKSFGYGELLLVRSKREIMRVAQKVYLGQSSSDRYLQTLMMAQLTLPFINFIQNNGDLSKRFTISSAY